jgi:alpha-beta hydrolase superfamily lysophospholipase
MTADQVQVLERHLQRTVELVFAGDHVQLAGQIDYPDSAPPSDGFPLLFVLHHAGSNHRDWYWPFAEIALRSGYAVFRWDKRGTGRSGASGRGSATQDAVNAYEIAIEQPFINPRRVIILAQDAGSALLGSSFGLFARIRKPHGAILVSNMLDDKGVLAVDTQVRILMAENDWNPWTKYARAACMAHNRTYTHGSDYYVVPGAVDRKLIEDNQLPPGARSILLDWLQELCRPSKSI